MLLGFHFSFSLNPRKVGGIIAHLANHWSTFGM
jgi:hypothetical protein